MTEQDLDKIKFQPCWHLNMRYGHTATYESIGHAPKIAMRIHTPYKDGVPKGRGYTHYVVNGKVFKRKKKLLEYLTEIESNNVLLNHEQMQNP